MLKDDDSVDDPDGLSGSEGEGKMDQYFKDLQKIKERSKQQKEDLAKLQLEPNTKLSKREEK